MDKSFPITCNLNKNYAWFNFFKIHVLLNRTYQWFIKFTLLFIHYTMRCSQDLRTIFKFKPCTTAKMFSFPCLYWNLHIEKTYLFKQITWDNKHPIIHNKNKTNSLTIPRNSPSVTDGIILISINIYQRRCQCLSMQSPLSWIDMLYPRVACEWMRDIVSRMGFTLTC